MIQLSILELFLLKGKVAKLLAKVCVTEGVKITADKYIF